MAGEKTEKPTAKRLKDARKRGQATVAVTPEIGGWVTVLVVSVMLPMLVRHSVEGLRQLLTSVAAVIARPELATALRVFRESGSVMVRAALPMMLAVVGAALVAHAAQGGFKPNMALLKPQAKRLNPFAGIKRMVGAQAVWQMVKVLGKSAVVAAVLWFSVSKVVPLLAAGGRLPLSSTLSVVSQTMISLLRNAAMAGLVFALADYFVAKRRLDKSLKMSKQDIKDEFKQTEGDPLVKSQIRSRQMAMSRNRMMASVKDADVIVVNPVHVAVALKYDPAKGAPRVLAKGAGLIAKKIREEADSHRIPLVENVPLARLLYKSCKLGAEIPAATYAAVAQVLAFVMSLKAKGSAAGFHRPPSMAE